MKNSLFILGIWLFTIWAETVLIPSISGVDPNLFFLTPTIICLRWRGPETWFIYAFFGLTADCFSSLAFATYGTTYFVLSFITRWVAIKMFQESAIAISFICGWLTLLQLLGSYILWMLIEKVSFRGYLFTQSLLFHVVPTILLSVPCFYAFMWLEKKLGIHLSERKY